MRRTLDTNKRKACSGNTVDFTISLGLKSTLIPAHQSAQAFLANHTRTLLSLKSHWSRFPHSSGFLCLDLEYN